MRETWERAPQSDVDAERVAIDTDPNVDSIEAQVLFDHLPEQAREVIGPEERALLERIAAKDQVTHEHSLAVTELVHRVWPAFAEELQQDGISYPAMIRATALHDVGKLTLPDCILKSNLQHDDLRGLFIDFCHEQPERANELLRAKGLLSGKRTVEELSEATIAGLDHRDLIPLAFLYRANPSAQAEIISSGLDMQMTFLEALKRHEAASQEIISGTEIPDRNLVAALAGTHHNYRADSEVHYQVSNEERTLPVTAAELLHVTDIYQSMVGARRYQPSMTEADAMARLRQMAEERILRKDVVERWVSAIRSEHPNSSAVSVS
ncbi:MAG: hypothetical protein ACOYUK_03905 [Patescibacteria group bacterium]